ncbi:MAG: hypothetical protein R3Y11_12800 [Pseudomonadota bacterium]
MPAMRFEPLTNAFDVLHHHWGHPKTERRVSYGIILIFLLSVLTIELNRWGFMPSSVAHYVPENHFKSVNIAFTLLLTRGLINMIFSISYSFYRSMGRQFEILAIMLLRSSFTELSNMHEPVLLELDMMHILHIVVSSSAAVVIFVCLGVYTKIHKPYTYIGSALERMNYVASKKIVALLLFMFILGIGGVSTYNFIAHGETIAFFESVYTVLIFADILLMLITQRFMPSFHAVFRNSGYVIATLFMRFALGAPPFYDAAVALFAAFYTVALTAATNWFQPSVTASRKTVRK